MKKVLSILFVAYFCCSCAYDTKEDFKERVKWYITIDDAICLHEKPIRFDKTYNTKTPILGYACFELKNKPNLKDFKLEKVSELSTEKDRKLFKDSQAALLHIISKSEDSEAKVALSNFLRKYHDNIIFVCRKDYPLILQIENNNIIKFIFYGVVFSPSSEMIYYIILYYP